MDDPYRILELGPAASDAEVRQARRRLAKRLHPDTGAGDAAAMAAVNRAYEQIRAGREPEFSFTVDVLPVDAFAAVEVAVAELGEVVSADEPYGLEAFLTEPARCFCVIDLVPEAGGTIVTLTVQAADDDGSCPPTADSVGAALVQRLTT